MLPGCRVHSYRQVDFDSKMWFTSGRKPELSTRAGFIYSSTCFGLHKHMVFEGYNTSGLRLVTEDTIH